MRAVRTLLVVAAMVSASAFGAEGDVHFDIVRFQVEGNSLLPEAVIQATVAPYVGRQRVYGDVQHALEALEGAYRKAGYGTVQVVVPEQELADGVVRLEVAESVIGKVTVADTKYFNQANVRAGLPALQEGRAPNMRELSENIQLSNENPAKQVEVTLAVSEEEGKVDAKVGVAEEDPQRFYLTFDNTGTGKTGKFRVGAAYQNANLFDQDQTVTLAYTTTPDAPDGVKVDIYSIGYRLPVYGWGDSFDFIYGNSSVNTPSTTPTLGTGLAINGKGTVMGVHWNHYFPRHGEYFGKLVTGLDYKFINTQCAGVPFGTPSCTPYTTRTLSLTYVGQRQRLDEAFDYNLGIYRNLPMGSEYPYTTLSGISDTDNYTAANEGRPIPNGFTYLKAGGSYTHLLPESWQGRIAVAAQYSGTPLPQSEQLGLAGSLAIRGFNERVVIRDKGWFANLELYTPELAGHLNLPGSMRALVFYDLGGGINYQAAPGTEKVSIASVGAGLRYALRKDVAVRLDFAQVVDAGPAATESRGDWRGHLSATFGF